MQLIAYGLLVAEHNRGARSSKVLGVFWLLAFIVGILRLRTAILKYERGLQDEIYRYGMYVKPYPISQTPPLLHLQRPLNIILAITILLCC